MRTLAAGHHGPPFRLAFGLDGLGSRGLLLIPLVIGGSALIFSSLTRPVIPLGSWS